LEFGAAGQPSQFLGPPASAEGVRTHSQQKPRRLIHADARGKPQQLLWSLIRVGHDDHTSDRRSLADQQTAAKNPSAPASAPDKRDSESFRDQGGIGVISKSFHPRWQARIHDTDDRLKSCAIGLNRSGVGHRG
jgi:hypothetical protein